MQELSAELFEPRVGQKFSVLFEDPNEKLDIELVEVSRLPETGIGRPEPFSLLFLGSSNELLPQNTYRLHNEDTGEIDIFIVPLGPDPETKRLRYEAIFS